MGAKVKQFIFGRKDIKINAKEWQIFIIGFIFIFHGIFAMTYAVFEGEPSWAIWLCYVGLLMIGIGALRKNSFLIATFLYPLFFTLIFWNIDFWHYFIFRSRLWGIADYFVQYMQPAARFISLEHFFLIPGALYLLYLIKLKRKDAWKLSWFLTLVIIVATVLFTNPEENVNCAFEDCTNIFPTEYYLAYWLLFLFVSSFIVSFVVNRIPIFFSEDFKNKKKLK